MSLLVLAFAVFVTNQAAQPASGDVRTRARVLLDALTSESYSAVAAEFDDKMKAAMPVARLAAMWSAVLAQAGDFTSCDADSRLVPIGDKRMVITSCTFDRGRVDVQFAFDAAGKVSGFVTRPGPTAVAPVAYSLPPYASPDRYVEENVTVGGPQWPLPGTLTLPSGTARVPAVVLVHGSGPHDRDSTIGPLRPFKDLALGLASRGIAVLRYDKRSKVFGARLAAPGSTTTVKEEVVDDAGAAITLLGRHPRIDAARIFVLGHSLGGTLVPRIAAANPSIAGAIVAAGAARPLEDIIVEQARYLAMVDGTIAPAEQSQIDIAMRTRDEIKALTSADASTTRRISGAPPSYWLDLRGYDPAATAAALRTPLLILQGERDFQVTMEDYARWRTALASRAGVTLHSYQSLNHMFVAGTGPSLPSEYAVAAHLDERVIVDIAQWILR